MFTKVLACCIFAIVASQAVQEEKPVRIPQPYSYSFDNTDDFGTRLTRQETGDENNGKVGSYSYVDPNGVTRTVKYVADQDGFRVKIETNEPGTRTSSPANAPYESSWVAPPNPAPERTAERIPASAKPAYQSPVPVQALQNARQSPASVQYSRPAPESVQYARQAPASVQYPQQAPASVQYARPAPVAVQTGRPAPEAVQYARQAPAGVQYSRPAPTPVQYARPAPEAVQYTRPSPPPVQYARPAPESVQYARQAPASIQYAQPAPAAVQYSRPAPAPVQYSHPAPATVQAARAGPEAARRVPISVDEAHAALAAAMSRATGGQAPLAYNASPLDYASRASPSQNRAPVGYDLGRPQSS
ncbi:skin secretory protein xP2-like [Ixodes scapularis]|uniref:skin secretory protein xP2-like n=1 Tax=Ixodes scapularis TaxID=6945 RepID=UPI001A9F4F33|nr:skin secretory protein xP2-like [Ixodes scapularis]